MNIKQLAFVKLLSTWCNGCLVDASYAVLGEELKISPVAAFLRTKTLEKGGWVKRRDGRLYLHPRFSQGSEDEWSRL